MTLESSPEPSVAGNIPGSQPANHAYYPALDGVRALAFILVFLNHYQAMPLGWAGVDIFFVLSGFLITGILFDTQNSPHRFRNFYLRRTLRIFPLYYGVFLLLLLLQPLFHWRWDWSWLIWPAYLGNYVLRLAAPFGSHLQSLADAQLATPVVDWLLLYLGHFWSLCVEEQFYLVWPWVVFTVRDRRKLMQICIAVLVLSPILRVVAAQVLPSAMLDAEVLYRWTPFRLDALLMGGLMALALRGGLAPVMTKASRAVMVFGGPVAALCWFLIPQRPIGTDWTRTWGLSCIDLLSSALVMLSLRQGSFTYKIFNFSLLRWMGRISYGAYLFHDIFHTLYSKIVIGLFERGYFIPLPWLSIPATTSLLAFASTFLMAFLSFRFFETPFIAMKNRYTR